ncbi:MAG: TauD/TfdA family dioxygenase [Gammaproteobacteria bacterium]|nr:TauD/TfdA family dioxygenase [Gammaproteobacteria bacterium]
MEMLVQDSPAAWRVDDLNADRRWVFTLDERQTRSLAATVRDAHQPDKPLFDYQATDFDLEPAWPIIAAALREAHHGRGIALVRGLPREGLDESQFELLNWAIGLRAGVARPQGKASQYISPVRDAGTDYRAATGRGYSSNAELDFHADGADLVTLACYNQARSGGQSFITSAVSAHDALLRERPDLAELTHAEFCYSRQGEQAPDEPPWYAQPIFDVADGRLFSKWNRNRIQSAQRFEEVPRLDEQQREAMNVLDAILRRPELMLSFYLQPGDLQILNNHSMLHSRSNFVDFDEPDQKRLLSRLWLAPPDSVRLPDSWRHFYRQVQPGSVRGGIYGHQYDDRCRAFDRRQADLHGMRCAA